MFHTFPPRLSRIGFWARIDGAMKHILIIDESELFREYLKERLSQEDQVACAVAVNGLDAIAKIRTLVPDLIIIDYHLSRKSCREVLEEKKRNPNTSKVPVIVTSAKIDKNRIMELLPFDVKKVFTKPIHIDSLLATVSSILGWRYEVDSTPCILDAHVNDNVIFVELAQGLNRDKIEMLRFKLAELLELYDIENPRCLLLLSDLSLSFADAPNLDRLLHVIITHSRAKNRYIRVLTNSSFVRDFIEGHKDYADIEAVTSLQAALDGLLNELSELEFGEGKAQVISDRVLSAQDAKAASSFQMRFEAEAAKAFAVERASEAGAGVRIAVVDDDIVIQEQVKTTFTSINAEVAAFPDGRQFLEALRANQGFDVVLLDLMMPDVGGFDVLNSMRAWDINIPVIVLSAVSQREAILKAFQAGVKSYLIKPLKTAALLKKTAEILRANF